MNNFNNNRLQKYILYGIGCVLLIGIAYIMFFVVLWGIIIGIIIYGISYLKVYFMPKNETKRGPVTIEHERD